MSFLECLRAALHSLDSNKGRAVLTTLGVVIGVMSVLLLIAFGEGAQAFIEDEFATLGSNIMLVNPGKQETVGLVPVSIGSMNKLTYQDSVKLKQRLRGVRGVAPYVLGAGTVQYGDRRRDTTILGVTSDFAPVRQGFPQLGRFIEQRDVERSTRVCVLGTLVARELFGNEQPLNQRVTINRVKHTVVGVMELKGQSLGLNLDDLVFIPLPSGQQMFHGGEDELFEIVIATVAKDALPYTRERVRTILTAAHDGVEDFTITEQGQILQTVGRVFLALRMMLIGIASIALIVGGIGIMNIMLVTVRERTKEVGVRKAVGARRRDIGLQFLVESATLSAFGGGVGVFAGWLVTVAAGAVYPEFPLRISPWAVATSFVFSLVVGVFFGVYPAMKAAAVDPVEALRYE